MHRVSLFSVCILLAACSNAPESFPVPPQRTPPAGSGYAHLGHFINMNDLNVKAYVIGGVSQRLESNTWRWTFRRPELRFFLQSTADLKFRMDFAIAGSTFQQTGPVTLSFFVNDKLLDRVHYTAPGQQRFEHAVPADLLRPQAENVVAIESDRYWKPGPGATALGFILVRAGFTD